MTAEKISLYYRAGNSDKEYHAHIAEKEGLYIVNFAFGRRGSTLQTGSKTASPVDYATAKKILDKLVSEKTAKGYTPGATGTPYAHTDKEQRSTGLLPQLLNPIEEQQATKLLSDSGYWLQQKYDGKRMLLKKDTDGSVTGINRKGLSIGLPQLINARAQAIAGSFVIDGEAVGEKLFAFDLLSHNGEEIAAKPYSERMRRLVEVAGRHAAISVARTATMAAEKRKLFESLQAAKAEGVVFKRSDAAYQPGRPASGGSQLKFKFVATCSCIVAKVNAGKRSVALELIGDAGQGVGVGNVTIPPNSKVPPAGTMVEVRYLYAFPAGSLFQPVYLGVRDDIRPEACTTAQLKYRAPSDDDA